MQKVLLKTPDPAGVFENYQIEALSWFKPGAVRTVLLFPPTGGVTWIDRYLLRRLRREKLNVLVLKRFTGAWERTPDLRVHDRGLKRGRDAGLKLMDWAKDHGAENRFGLIGSSMGALFAGMLANHPAIDRLVLIAGGSPVSQIVARTWMPALLPIWWWRLRRYDIASQKKYAKVIARHIENDLSDTVYPRRDRRDLFFIGKRDLLIPVENQRALIKRANQPEVIELNAGHFRTILTAETWAADRICKHMY